MKWISIGSGLTYNSFEGRQSGLSFGFSGHYEYQKRLFTLQYIGTGELGTGEITARPFRSTSHFGILYSAFKKFPETIVSFGIGPSFTRFRERGELISNNSPSASEYEKIISNKFGFIFNGQAFIYVKHGLGINLYANLNTKNSFVGLLFSLHFGKFR
jgi:hypothetical protein